MLIFSKYWKIWKEIYSAAEDMSCYLYTTLSCSTLQDSAVQCCTAALWRSNLQCSKNAGKHTVCQYSAVQHCERHSAISHCNAVQCTELCTATQCSARQHSAEMQWIAVKCNKHSTIQYACCRLCTWFCWLCKFGAVRGTFWLVHHHLQWESKLHVL